MATATEVRPLSHFWWHDPRGRVECGRCGYPPEVLEGVPCKGPCRVCGEDVLADMACPDFKVECVDCCGCHDD